MRAAVVRKCGGERRGSKLNRATGKSSLFYTGALTYSPFILVAGRDAAAS